MIIKTKPSNAIIEYLTKNKIVNLNIIGVIENEPEAEIYVDNEETPNIVLVRYEYFNYIYTEDDELLDEMLENLFKDNFYGFSGVHKPLAEKIIKRYSLTWENKCALYYLPEAKLDLSLIKNPVKAIDSEDAKVVDEFYTYRHPGSIEQIKKDIFNRPSSAVYVNDDIASWVLVHNDNSMGIMYTKEEYRKKGYAVDATIGIASKIISLGKTPFLHIVTSNTMSLALATKCDFVKYDYLDFFGIIAGVPPELIDVNNNSKINHLKTIEDFNYIKDVKLNCMYLPMYCFKDEYEKIQGFSITKVADMETINIWCETFIDGIDLKEETKDWFRDIVYKAVSNSENAYTLYIGMLNGKPVSTTAFQKFDDDVLGLYFTAVKDEINRNEIRMATIIEALTSEKNDHLEFVVIQSPEEYAGMMKKMGFVHSH
ncbi:GNAT family N-acetyltransferase [Clostridium tagluense]|uniref:GNAT family N-acetyltransferase n=1 Tax=Clostridium tagluense TaxID=360422 RepID=UPI001C6F3FCA|nr:GNAT family N-acetyltransferase [Clostridium tagluense]MBW9157765.1 GNAT family N-acetyltransferase [Clostridium tagluense]WLC63743.1 GNAT family N-acetyltransferase [Clostridium tagluense]